ncbi:MAG: hypothetical protein PHS43_07485, partial [Firmicutes bacterium]|nr:hypothetical protein [Bacillota bacterium]
FQLEHRFSGSRNHLITAIELASSFLIIEELTSWLSEPYSAYPAFIPKLLTKPIFRLERLRGDYSVADSIINAYLSDSPSIGG